MDILAPPHNKNARFGTTIRGGVSGPSVTINGLTAGVAPLGDYAGITMSASEGTISARSWGSSIGGSEFGTGTSPTDYDAAAGGRLYATATIDGEDYSRSAPIEAATPDTFSFQPGTDTYDFGSASSTGSDTFDFGEAA